MLCVDGHEIAVLVDEQSVIDAERRRCYDGGECTAHNSVVGCHAFQQVVFWPLYGFSAGWQDVFECLNVYTCRVVSDETVREYV